jgi:hypothetical protein
LDAYTSSALVISESASTAGRPRLMSMVSTVSMSSPANWRGCRTARQRTTRPDFIRPVRRLTVPARGTQPDTRRSALSGTLGANA